MYIHVHIVEKKLLIKEHEKTNLHKKACGKITFTDIKEMQQFIPRKLLGCSCKNTSNRQKHMDKKLLFFL